jgi:hypothetical protein
MKKARAKYTEDTEEFKDSLDDSEDYGNRRSKKISQKSRFYLSAKPCRR